MTDYITTDTELTSIANAIRTKGSTSASLTFPNGFVSAIQNIPSGSGGGDINALIDGTLSIYTNSEVIKIRDCTFYKCSALTEVSFPECVTIGASAFYACKSLATVSFPECTFIGTYAFELCSALTTVSFPECTFIGAYAFGYCSSLATVSFPKCTQVAQCAFLSCSNLFSLYLTGPGVALLDNANVFTNTPMSTSVGGVYGSIFVPASLYSDYIIASNWSVYSSRFVSV